MRYIIPLNKKVAQKSHSSRNIMACKKRHTYPSLDLKIENQTTQKVCKLYNSWTLEKFEETRY